MEVALRRFCALVHAEDAVNDGLGTVIRGEHTTAANRILAIQPGGLTPSNMVTRLIATEVSRVTETEKALRGSIKGMENTQQDRN